MPEFLDGLSFPFLASGLILAANFASTRSLNNARNLLTQFSEVTGKYSHPKRMLWLTDTLDDKNGVSLVLRAILKEIQRRNLPVDLLVCSSTVVAEDHLIVVPPQIEIELPVYSDQPLRIPDFLDVHHRFEMGEYDRIICSTEGPMGIMALYLKHAFCVQTQFFIHTDWMMFAKKALSIDVPNLNRLRRALRAYYRMFDSVFVLNSDHKKWLSGKQMGIQPEKVLLTAHWVEDYFCKKKKDKQSVFGVKKESRVILFSGRISLEKGILELPVIYESIISEYPDAVMVIAGNGPDVDLLKALLPQAHFLGWVEHSKLPEIYSSADIMVFPSRFDTFSCSVLESMSCGLPVLAYKTKGPRDIITDGENGLLAENLGEFRVKLLRFFSNPAFAKSLSKQAFIRASEYNKEKILNSLLHDSGFNNLA
jgi:glycosyltransferase involved in cell wall biosynthesis